MLLLVMYLQHVDHFVDVVAVTIFQCDADGIWIDDLCINGSVMGADVQVDRVWFCLRCLRVRHDIAPVVGVQIGGFVGSCIHRT